METNRATQLLINEPPLQVLPTLAKLIGLNEAIFLQQLHYWLRTSKHDHEGRSWVYNTYDEWHAQLSFYSLRTIKTIIANLQRKKLIIVKKLSSKALDRTNYFTIDYDQLAQVYADWATSALPLGKSCPMDQADPAQCYKEAETTNRFSSRKQQSRAQAPASLDKDQLQRDILALKDIPDFDVDQYVAAHAKARIPLEITAYVIREFVKYKDTIRSFWAYGQTILRDYWPEYNYQQQLARHYELKQL